MGERGDAGGHALAVPPAGGGGNGGLIRFPAKLFGLARRDFELVRGDASREKLVAVAGLSLVEVEVRLRAAFSR